MRRQPLLRLERSRTIRARARRGRPCTNGGWNCRRPRRAGGPRDRALRWLHELSACCWDSTSARPRTGAVPRRVLRRAARDRCRRHRDPRRRTRRARRLFADLCELSRNRPGARGTPDGERVHSPREHFHTYLHRLDPERGTACRTQFRERARAGCSPTTASPTSNGPASWRRPSSARSSSQRATTVPTLAIVTTLLERWLGAAGAVSGRCPPCPRGARPARARRSAALPGRRRPGPQRPVPLVRRSRSSTRRAPACSPRVGEQLAGARERPRRARPGRTRSTRSSRSPSRSCASSPNASSPASRHRPAAQGLVRRHYREYAPRRAAIGRRAGRPFAVADYVLDARRPTWSPPSATIAEIAPGSGLVEAVTAQVAARAPGQQAVVDLYLAWPDAPESQNERPTSSPNCSASCPWPRRATGRGSGLPGRRAGSPPTSRCAPMPGEWSRTTSCGACTRWSVDG